MRHREPIQHARRRRRTWTAFIAVLVAGVGSSRSGTASPYVCGQARDQLQAIDTAIDMYVLRFGHLPPEESWWLELHESGSWNSPDRPTDPWGHPIVFEWQGDSYELMTLGYDGVRGTADDQIRALGWADTGVCRAERLDSPTGNSGCGQ